MKKSNLSIVALLLIVTFALGCENTDNDKRENTPLVGVTQSGGNGVALKSIDPQANTPEAFDLSIDVALHQGDYTSSSDYFFINTTIGILVVDLRSSQISDTLTCGLQYGLGAKSIQGIQYDYRTRNIYGIFVNANHRYHLAKVDIANNAIEPIGELPFNEMRLGGQVVCGRTGKYAVAGRDSTYIIDLQSAKVVHSISGSLHNMEFNDKTNEIVGYKFQVSATAPLSQITGINITTDEQRVIHENNDLFSLQEGVCTIDKANERYVFKAVYYNGANTPTTTILYVDLQSGEINATETTTDFVEMEYWNKLSN